MAPYHVAAPLDGSSGNTNMSMARVSRNSGAGLGPCKGPRAPNRTSMNLSSSRTTSGDDSNHALALRDWRIQHHVPSCENAASICSRIKRTKIPKIRAAVRQALNRAMVGDFQQIVIMLRSHDALKRVATTKPITNHPKDYASLPLQELAKLMSGQLLVRRDD
jgi:hypothetical protein